MLKWFGSLPAPFNPCVDIGEYRIVYRIEDDTVGICLIGKRNDSEVYKRFKRSP